jgi:hypothetical protein
MNRMPCFLTANNFCGRAEFLDALISVKNSCLSIDFLAPLREFPEM